MRRRFMCAAVSRGSMRTSDGLADFDRLACAERRELSPCSPNRADYDSGMSPCWALRAARDEGKQSTSVQPLRCDAYDPNLYAIPNSKMCCITGIDVREVCLQPDDVGRRHLKGPAAIHTGAESDIINKLHGARSPIVRA